MLDLTLDQKDKLTRMQFRAQQYQYRSLYPHADFDLVLIDSEAIGNLYVQRGPHEFVLIDISLLPGHRNSGIGAGLVRKIIVDAKKAGRPLQAHVLKHNPAWRLWQRLGFHLVSDDGIYLRIEVSAGNSRYD